MSPSAFQHHYEKNHMPLITSLAGPAFPKSHTRTYFPQEKGGRTTIPAAVVARTNGGSAFDAITEMVFESERHWKDLTERLWKGDAVKKIEDDEELFLDRSKTEFLFAG